MTRVRLVVVLLGLLTLQAPGQIRESAPEGSLPRLTRPLVIDAGLDEWEGATSLSLLYASYISRVSPGREWRGPLDAGAHMSCAWNDDGLCIAVIVADDSIHNERPPNLVWQQDCLEIYIDGRIGEKFMNPPYSKGAYQLFVRPPVGKSPAALYVNKRDGTIDGLRIAGRQTRVGYTVEMLIPWAAFPGLKPEVGSELGLQFALCDYDTRDKGTNQPMVMSWRAATQLFQSPQKLVLFQLVKSVPFGADELLGSVVDIDIPRYIVAGDSAMFSVDTGNPLAPMADTVDIVVSDWTGKVVLQTAKHLKRMAFPWTPSARAVCEWEFGDIENGPYQVEVQPKNARGEVLGTASRVVVIARKPFLRWHPGSKPTILAHRGAPPPDLPENSIAAFERALADGADFIEIDVRQSKDGEFIVFHDDGLGRCTTGGHDDRVADHTLAELKTFFLRNQAGEVTTHKIPTLKETIDWARGKTVLFLDVKIMGMSKVVQFVQAEHAQAFCVPMTWRREEALEIHQLAPEMVLYTSGDDKGNNVEKLLNGDIPTDRLFVYVTTADESVINRMHANGIMVQCGGVQGNDEKSYLRWLEKGVDSFNTDSVQSAAAAIQEFRER